MKSEQEKENSERIRLNNVNGLKSERRESDPSNETNVPRDGGFRAYSVLLGSFLMNGFLFGIMNSCGVINNALISQLKNDNVTNYEIRSALVGSLTLGTTFLLSPLSGVLTALMGLRMTAVLGGTIATTGLLLSSFVVKNVDVLCFTYGVMYGLGASLAYTPSLAILSHYFKRHLGIANGVVTVGSSVFTALMVPLMNYMVLNYDLPRMFRVLTVFNIGIALCGLIFKPVSAMEINKKNRNGSFRSLIQSIIDVEIWKNKKYMLWALLMPVPLFGYYVPYVHLSNFVQETFFGANTDLPMQCMAITSGIGRIIFGLMADKTGIDKILLQQISFYCIGTLTIILPFVTSFPLVVAIWLGMGIFDGGFISLIGPIAVDLCGTGHAAQAIGCMLGLAAIPLTLGPLLAAHLIKINSNYTLAFVLAGISPLLGATLMFTIRFVTRCSKTFVAPNANGHLSPSSDDAEKVATSLLHNGDVNEQTSL